MAQTFGCSDIEDNGCQWRIVTEEGEDDLIVESTIKHAQSHHPDFAADRQQAEQQIRARIGELLRQSRFYEQQAVLDSQD